LERDFESWKDKDRNLEGNCKESGETKKKGLKERERGRRKKEIKIKREMHEKETKKSKKQK
jgi:hypothetical protein